MLRVFFWSCTQVVTRLDFKGLAEPGKFTPGSFVWLLAGGCSSHCRDSLGTSSHGVMERKRKRDERNPQKQALVSKWHSIKESISVQFIFHIQGNRIKPSLLNAGIWKNLRIYLALPQKLSAHRCYLKS